MLFQRRHHNVVCRSWTAQVKPEKAVPRHTNLLPYPYQIQKLSKDSPTIYQTPVKPILIRRQRRQLSWEPQDLDKEKGQPRILGSPWNKPLGGASCRGSRSVTFYCLVLLL